MVDSCDTSKNITAQVKKSGFFNNYSGQKIVKIVFLSLILEILCNLTAS